MRLLFVCLVVAAVIYVVSDGQVLFLPLLLLLPLGGLARRRKQRRSWP